MSRIIMQLFNFVYDDKIIYINKLLQWNSLLVHETPIIQPFKIVKLEDFYDL